MQNENLLSFVNVFDEVLNLIYISYHTQLSLQIGGIGKVTEHILRDVLGINTCEDMLQKGGLLCALFSRSAAG